MKKISLLVVVFFTTISVSAQTLLPVDTAVRIGRLPNGMTYYIRHNDLPKNSVDFHIAQQVGSILEEENQRGLAHFLEHMAFNGTKHFPESTSLRDYLESVGVKFGANLNAFTSIDETIYKITNVPTSRSGIIDSCLLILHDWSNALLLTDEEIDKERGVIHEEWRTGQSAIMRMYEQILPEIYGTDRYAHRLPIGIMSVIDNFKYQELRDYYKKWYRPDLQGIVIVGDIDVDDIENRIKTIFADISAPENPTKREYFPVTNNDEPIFSIATDPETTVTYLLMCYKHDAVPTSIKNTEEYMILSYIQSMAVNMFNARLNEISQKKSAPFAIAEAYDRDFLISKTKGSWEVDVMCKDGMVDSTLACITHEIQRIKRYGFTETEYIRAKADFLKSLEVSYNERDKEKNSHYTQQYIDNFLDAEPITSIDFDYQFFKQNSDKISVSDINSYMNYLITDKNNVVILMANSNSQIPTKQQLADVFAKASTDSVSAYVDDVPSVELINGKLKKGKIKSDENGMFETECITLKNGIRVVLAKSDLKKDEILMSAYSMGGTSLLDEKQMPTIHLLDDIIDLGGLGEFSSIDLQKVLAGKNIALAPHISLNAESFSGSCSPSDFETFLQLLYLYFTSPRADEEAYDAYISSIKTVLEKAEKNPKFILNDSINKTIYGNHPRAEIMKIKDVDKVDYQLAMQMYRERFMNADDFTFVFVGNMPDSTLKLIEKYLGALPKVKQSETYKNTGFEQRKGEWINVFNQKMEIAKSTVYTQYFGSCEYNLKNSLKMSFLSQLLRIVYTKTIREDEGGTYGVAVYGEINKFPTETFEMYIYFDTDPDKCRRMKDIMYEQLNKLSKDGFADEDFLKVKEYMQKHFKEVQIENSYWLSLIKEYYMLGVDKYTTYEQTLNEITKEDIRLFLNNVLSQNNKAEIVMMPKE